jgi:hypothetical protein
MTLYADCQQKSPEIDSAGGVAARMPDFGPGGLQHLAEFDFFTCRSRHLEVPVSPFPGGGDSLEKSRFCSWKTACFLTEGSLAGNCKTTDSDL